MRKFSNVISYCVLLSLVVVLDDAYAKQPQKSAEVSAISLDVLRVKACAVGQGCSTVGGPKQWNLFNLAEGKTDFANQVLMPAKTNELRLMLGSKSTITVDGQTYPLTVPSGQVSGLKLMGNKIFASKSGFLKSIRLNFDPAKGLVVQAQKVKGKGKKDKDTVVYSYSLKPVIQVSSAEVTPMPENMAGVFVMPDESSKLKMGNDFLLSIPVGAVSAPVLVTAEEIKYFVEVKDEASGQLVKKAGLASTYDLKPEGTQFVKPVKVSVRYHTDTLPVQIPESDLAVFHDGNRIPSQINTVADIATGNISHFSSATVSFSYEKNCKKTDVEDGIYYHDCNSATAGYPDFHAVIIDRVKLKDKYRLKILAEEVDVPTLLFKTKTVESLAGNNDAIVAINASYFGPNTVDYSKEDEQAFPIYTTVMNNLVKKDYSGKEVLIAFGDDGNGKNIPIERITKDQFKLIRNGKDESRKKILDWSFGTDATILELNSEKTESTCKYKYKKNDSNSGLTPLDEEISAIGYSDKEIIFIASDLDSYTDGEFDTWNSLCEVFRARDVRSQAVALDSGCSVQLTVNGDLKNGVCKWDHKPEKNDDGTYNYNDDGTIQKNIYWSNEARHVVNAIGLVPKDLKIKIIVNSIYPLQAVQGKPITFTVNGQNLPSTLALEIDGCNNMVALGGTPTVSAVAATSMNFYSSSNTFTSRFFSCTPSSAGVKTCSVRDTQGEKLLCNQGENLLCNFNVNFAEDAVTPEVNSVSPNTATLNEPITFTVTGQNLPSTLAFWISECENVTSLGGSSTSMRFSCTPSYTTGEKSGIIKDVSGGTVLKEFTINVSGGGSTPPESSTCTSGSQTATWQGRVWQRCDDGKTYTWQEAKNYCDNLALGGYSDWRLPTKDELKSLVVCTNGTPTPLADSPATPYSCESNNNAPYAKPTIDSSFECRSDYYWTSSTKEGTIYMWDVYFYYGHAAWDNPTTNHFYVRCIR